MLYAITSNAAGDGLMSKTLDMAGRAEAVALMQNMADGFSKINVPDPNKLVPFIESVTGSVMSIMEVNIPIFIVMVKSFFLKFSGSNNLNLPILNNWTMEFR